MLTRPLLAAALGVALLAVPAGAAETTNKSAQAATTTGEWQTSKLIHMNVYNNNNEKIGDIKELMTDNTGKIENVVIGVGGFLGMGEHDVAVKFSELKWIDAPVSSSTATSSSNTARGKASTTGSTANTTTANTTTARNDRTYPDHAVYNATKDQLKALPEFKYNK
jgi:sporulation protein YlmC with PRC-barrel domain